MDTSKQSNFFDGLRSAVRLTGSEGKILTLVFTARDLEDPVYLDAINSLLISGEYPHLFSNDELEGLLMAIGPAMKREFPSMSVDPMKFFIARVRCNLHVIICIQPGHNLLQIASKEYPGLLSGCNINYTCDWPQEALLGDASYFITKNQMTEEFEDLSEHITTCLANIHSFVLRDCRQIPWAGDLNPEVTLTSVKQHDKKKEQLKVTSSKVPNLPYSKIILHERIRMKHRASEVAKNEVFVGPTTFRRFMECFRYLYNVKSKERTETVEQLKKVLATLDQTRSDAKVMKKAIKNTTGKFEEAKIRTEQLLENLTLKATILEKLKAKVGLSTSLDAYLHLNEMETEEHEEDELLQQEEYDDYDKEFDKMREATLKTRGVQAREELSSAKNTVEECRKQLEYAKEQVFYWKSKVDRNVIERLKGFSNPPVLVGMVMEMIMILIGKRLPSQRIEVQAFTGKEENMSSRMSSSSSGTKIVKKSDHKILAKKDETGRVDRAQWKAMQNTMTDTSKFVDMLHNVSWEDGLPEDVLRAVESYLSQGKDGELGVTGEGSLLDNAQDVNIHAKKRTPSPDNTKGITIAAARYSSEDAATLVHYTIAIVEYTRRCGPLKASLERMHELEREIEENDRLQKEKEKEAENMNKEEEAPQQEPEKLPEKEYDEDDLPQIQDEVNQLQAEFDKAVVEKHSLEMELISMNERLKAATEMVDSLKGQEAEWKQHVKDNDSNELLLANCISASAFLTYGGPHNIDTRKRMGEFFMQVCEHHGMPLPKKCLFRNMPLVEFLYTKLDIMHLEILRLPITPLMLENACFLMQGESITAWPLICDPTSRIIEWLRFRMKEHGLVEVRYTEIRSQLENCLADGSPLLVTDCDINKLAKDSRFRYAIQRCSDFINGRNRFKIIVEDHEVECDPKFRLFLHTTVEPHMVPQQLAAYASVIFFQLNRKDVEEEFLDRFMAHEKSRLEDERTALRQERQENMTFLDKLEKQMRINLSSDVRLMNDLQATKKLAELKKQFDETVETQTRVEASEGSILKARDGFRSIAQRAAVCFDVTQYMREVNPLYQISYNRYLDLYDAAISHSERSAVKAVLEKVTSNAYHYTARGLFERDRFIYALLLALEVEDSLNHIGAGEREFLISPDYSSVVMLSLGHIQQSQESKIAQTKKPFDWMTDDQFHNLQVLATHFEWFQEMFDRMPKDGRETQWRNLCETDSPETAPLPDKMDDVYKPMQRLCVVRAVRSDKIMQASTVFINVVLGKNSLPPPAGRKGFYGDVGIDLMTLLKQSSPLIPIMLMYSREADVAIKMFSDFAIKKQSKTLLVSVTDNNPNTERTARKHIQKAMSEGMWVLLHNAQNAPNLLLSLESVLEEMASTQTPDPHFRVWISCMALPEALPVRLIQNCIKTIIDSPKVMKDSIVRSFNNFEPDILKQSTRAEWPLILHNLCYLHAAIQLRTRYGHGGWNCPQDFHHIGNFELQESLNFIASEFKDQILYVSPDGTQQPRTTSWTGIRYMLSEVIYGSYSTDVNDQQSLSAMIDYWISPTAVKKDFEVARLKYRHPPAFFNPNVRLPNLIQALEGINYHFLDVPEGCHIHPNVETLLGDDQYVFTRLNKVFDVMPSSETLSHKLFPRPPTPFEGPALAGISSQSNNPAVVGQGVFATASFATFKMRKEVELWEICFTMLQKVPKAYNKDYIVEKVRKLGGFTTFNCYIMKELETMYRLLTEIKQTLTTIRNACETENLGDMVSETVLCAADDLFHLRIPRVWCQMSGASSPPLTWGLGSWLNELQNRCHHFEKILILGREKMPAYWLGAFFNPRGLLALIKQDYIRQYSNDRSGNFEQFVFQTEVTARDKDHLRDPPQDGMFLYGIYIWGCAWEKTTGELQDAPPRSGYATLPVVHVTCWPVNEKPILQDSNRAAETYQCPVYASRIATREPIMELDVRREGIPSARWSLRGLSATIRPY